MSKKQDNSSIPKKSSVQKWADAVTINDNSNQRSIELRFNAEPSPKLQPKLRAMGFRHSKSQVMWYGENTQQAMDFARQVESTLPTSPEGPDLFISPTFDAVKTNIEKKEFSYVMITLKDGQTKSYIVFEPSKPKAEVIAGNFAKEKFGNEFLALAAKPRLHTKEARVLFDEGKIIFPQGQKVPTHKESSIKGLQEEITVEATDEVAETISENLQEAEQTVQTKPNADFKRLYTPDEEKEIIEQFLAQGFQRPFSAHDAFDQQYPVVDVAFRYDTPTEYFTENIEEPNMKKVQKLNKELKELKGKGTNEKREKLKAKIDELTTQVNKAEQLINDEADIFHDDLFQIILDKAKEKSHRPKGEDEINRFREYVMNNILDNRAIENYHRQPLNELVYELIDEYFNEGKSVVGADRPSAGTDKANATDLKLDDTLVPNVLVPSSTTEPFYSHLFRMYDMKEILKNNFPHLLKLNDKNLESASPIALFELMQFSHPSEYGIDVSRGELINEFEKRGKRIFQSIGFPTDDNYPYVNLYLGYESIEPLNEMLFDNNKEGNEWWAIAENARPIADAKKALKIIDQMIAKEKQEMKTYLNPKTGKPKLDSKHLVRDIELTIESLKESKQVLQHYLDNPSDESASQTEEKSTDPLANESGIFTEKTAGENFEEIEIPFPKGAQFEASISIVQTSNGDFKMGINAYKKFGDHSGMANPASIIGQSYSTREEALKYALKELELRLDILIASKDSILNNEEKKSKQLNMALNAVKVFAEENGITLTNDQADDSKKIPLKEILLITFPNGKMHRSETRTVYSWKEANEYFRKRKWVNETLQLKVIWKDGENFERSMDYSHAQLFPGENPISEFVYQFNLTISKTKHLKNSKAQKLIKDYSFSDSDSESKSANIIKGLETAYWTDEDEKDESYPFKIIIDGKAFHALTLQERLLEEIKKLQLEKQIAIADQVSEKFKVVALNDFTTDSGSTIRDGKLPLKTQVVQEYFYDLSTQNDFTNPQPDKTILGFLIDILFNKQDVLVDAPVIKEKKQVIPKAKKQSQYDLNKEIESFIDKKDKDGSYFNAEEKNYIRQYTGSGGLLKEGATGRGALYEYYTPEIVVQKMWGMAKEYGYDGGSVLEPAVGTGNFLKYAPQGSIVFGFETNHYSARIAQVLYPHAHIHEKAFESLFFAGNIHLKDKFDHPLYSLVIGNPPYGEFTGKYAGMGEKQHTGATEYDQYFILRGLDLLKKNGLLVFLIPSSFMSNGSKFNKVKEKIAAKADFVDCYRLPSRIFETTDIGTDILVLRKNK